MLRRQTEAQAGCRFFKLRQQRFQTVGGFINQRTNLIGADIVGRELLRLAQPFGVQRQLFTAVPFKHLLQIGQGLLFLRCVQVQVRIQPQKHVQIRGIVVAGDDQATA